MENSSLQKRVYVKTLGCKVNTFDSHAIENQFVAHGFVSVANSEEADVTVVNTCSVTSNAEKEARYLARKIRRDNPASRIVFTGCYAQTDSAKLVEMSDIDIVVPNEVKNDLVPFVLRHLSGEESVAKIPENVKVVRDNKQSHFKSSLTFFDQSHSEKTRSFIKIQDGCNGFCTYCLIPYARGASRSVEREKVLAEIERVVQLGSPEVVLTGIHIGDYGADLYGTEENHFAKIVRDIAQIPGMKRLRISSLEPSELTEELLVTLKQFEHIFCDHLHLPLQSGSARVLKHMRRQYTKEEYKRACDMAQEFFPGINLGADVIPGFPGETDEEFEETIQFIRECGLNYLHVFPYSKRSNTAAERMPGHLDGSVIRERAARLRSLSNELAREYAKKFIGRTISVLWEKEGGLSRNYLKVASTQTPHRDIEECTPLGFDHLGRLLVRV